MPFTAKILHFFHPSMKSVHSIMTGSCVKKPWESSILFNYTEIFFLHVKYPRSNKTYLPSDIYLTWVIFFLVGGLDSPEE